MAMLEEDKEELLQRRLEEKIKANVETKLFRYYRNLGTAIVTVLGLIGILIGWPTLQTQIESTINIKITDLVQQPVEEAKKKVSELEKLAQTSRQTVEIGLEIIKEKQTRITDTLAKLDASSYSLNRTFAKVYAQIETLDNNAKDLEQKMYAFNEQFKYNLATQDDINAINRDIATLAEQSRNIAGVLQRIEGANGIASKNITSSFQEVASQAKVRSETVTDTKSTVYVQFAGGSREDIKLVTTILQEKEWLIPGEERTSIAANRKEIRYFHKEDKNTAEQLMNDTNVALSEIGFGSTKVKVTDYTSFQKPPRPGVLELWLEIPLR